MSISRDLSGEMHNTLALPGLLGKSKGWWGLQSALSTSEDSDIANCPASSSSFASLCRSSQSWCTEQGRLGAHWNVAFVCSPDVNKSSITPGEKPSLHLDSPIHSPFAHPEPKSAILAECVINAQECWSRQGPRRPAGAGRAPPGHELSAESFTKVLKIPAHLTPAFKLGILLVQKTIR